MRKGLKIYLWLGLAALMMLAAGLSQASDKVPQSPNPGVIDRITHDRGNIQTTVQNFGYVGGYSWAGYPSGRWPANTEHDYLAEMRFWIGGVNAAGDTVLANTADDFNPIPSYIAGNLSHDIRLSTDPERYDYDAADTVGISVGRPAYGWRVWDAVTRDWVYNQVYNPLDSNFYDGGPLGVQESICRYADDAQGYSIMGLEITQTIRQWNYEYNKDIIFFTLEIENAGAEDLTDVAIGLYCDFDIGGTDPATGENGRLGDLVAYDSELDLAWTYDEDGYDPGWGPSVVTGNMGTVVLSTPGDIGMTSFNTGQWEYLPQSDLERYEMINNTEFDVSLPPTDQYYVQAVRGIDLPAGEIIQFDFALVAAPNAEFLFATAERAKALYESYYNGPTPPDAPIVKATAGDRAVKLYWDDTSENSVELTTGEHDFKGYKVYRSTDQGASWGTLVTNPDYSQGPNYYPVARYEYDAFSRIGHTYIDSSVTNGLEYWYCVTSYDTGAPDMSIDTLENTKLGPDNSTNTVSVVPRDDALGYLTPQATVKNDYTGNWQPCHDDAVTIYVVNEAEVTGDDYRVFFTEDCQENLWNLVNMSTGDTVLADQDQWEGVNSTYPVVDGMQVIVKNVDRYPTDVYQSAYAVPGETTISTVFCEQFSPDYGCNDLFRGDIELRFTADGSIAYEWFTGAPMTIPFEAWNVTQDMQVGVWIADWYGDGEWTVADEDYIILTGYDYDEGNFHPEALPDYLTWIMEITPTDIPSQGDVLAIDGPQLVSPDDQINFSSNKISAALASENLNRIKVVPNPYLGHAEWDTGPGERKLQFTNLPEGCTIRIYTLAGDLIRTLTNDTDGTVDWDMLSEAGRGIASGVYLFNVESGYGNHTGKFAVVK